MSNGTPSSSAQFGTSFISNNNDSNLSFLSSGKNTNSISGSYSNTFGSSSWIRPQRLSTDAIANLYTRNIATDNTRDPWGLTSSPIIDDDERVQSTVNHQQDENLNEGLTSEGIGAEEAEELPLEVGEVAEAAGASTPWGLAAIVNQQLGQATSQAITKGLQNQSTSDYASNINSHGLNVGLNASIIQSQQENTIRNQETGGLIGSFFGPIGALIGHAVAGYASQNMDQLKTAGSFDGMINPQQQNIVSSMTTTGDPGIQTQVDNVDTGND